MAARNSSNSYKLRDFITTFYRDRILGSRFTSQGQNKDIILLSKLGPVCVMNQGRRLFSSSSSGSFPEIEPNKFMDEAGLKVPPPIPSAPKYYNLIFNWMKWLMACILSTLIPFWKLTWKSLPRLEEKVEDCVEEVEEVVEVVEKIATITGKASAVVADSLPEKTKFKEAALVVEHFSDLIIQDAEQTKKFINKVEDLKQDIKGLESIVEPVIDNILEMEHSKRLP